MALHPLVAPVTEIIRNTLRAEPLLSPFALFVITFLGTKHMYRKKRFCSQGELETNTQRKNIHINLYVVNCMLKLTLQPNKD